ncbi:hypothetical protein AXF42_Ash007147 [Apostasia shenzhenica]|uniref:Uncharacterized protein n=1 Tax=Apostasia shenzhenica TaxID=1088818 RepID=A0A2I0BF84_9ASPA|nr:hypothetical protein AXF42_Ash007147 [Apostasia shenzhenica]
MTTHRYSPYTRILCTDSFRNLLHGFNQRILGHSLLIDIWVLPKYIWISLCYPRGYILDSEVLVILDLIR